MINERFMENIGSKSDLKKDEMDKELMMDEEAFVNMLFFMRNKSMR